MFKSPAEQCDLVGVKLEKIHEFFQVSRYYDNIRLVMK